MITFEESARTFIVESFGKAIDEDGFIVEKDDFSQKVLTEDGEEIHITQFGGVRNGSTLFMKSDTESLLAAAKRMRPLKA